MPFLLDSDSLPSEMADSINYLLANFGANLSADPNSGEISGPSGIIIAYLYRYLAVKYADSADGSVNFSNSPTNRQYYGLRNTNDTTESTNPADYIWNKVAGAGFGTTKFLFYQTNGGRQINFVVDTVAPDSTYLQESGPAIDLDVVTTTTAYNTAAPSIYIWTSTSTPPARPTTTSTYTWATGAYTAPAGWTTAPITNTTPGSYLWAITIPLVVSSNVTTSILDWTNVTYPLYAFSYNGDNGASGDSVDIVFRRSATQPATPAPSVGTPTGWFSDVNSIPPGPDPIWSSVGTNTGLGTNYVWQTPLLVEGQDGADGLSIAEVLIYIRASSLPATPTGGSYNFSTQTLTPPAGWTSGIPAGTDPVYTSRAVASVQGTTGIDTTLTWSSPVLSIQNGVNGSPGDSVDIVFRRSATQPATPSPSVGTPAGWYSDVNSVPAGTDPLWSSVGTNTGTGTNYVWQTPVLIEGQNGADGLSIAEVLIYLRSSTAPATPTGGSYNFTTQTLTAPAGWSSGIPAGTDPVYTSRAVASIQGITGTDSTLTWSAPVLSIQNGATGATGATGISAITAYLVQSQAGVAPSTPSNTTGPTAPAGWSLTAPAVSVGQVLWYSFGRYNSSSGTIDGVPAGQTSWGTPTAASIFQDIRSDNWNGSNPPVAGTISTHGTAGYYIQRSTGDMYLNSVYGRGVARFDGLNSGTGGVTAAILANPSLDQNAGVEGYTNNTFLSSGALRAFNQSGGGGNAIFASHLGTGNAVFAQSASGTGVLAAGTTGVVGSGTVGVQGNGSGPGGLGVQAQDLGGGTAALDVVGTMRINNSTRVTNLNAEFAGTLLGTTSNQLRFVSGTSSGVSLATFSGTKPGGASTNVWMTMQIDATTIYIPVWT
jgi:hypothetical protein